MFDADHFEVNLVDIFPLLDQMGIAGSKIARTRAHVQHPVVHMYEVD